MKKETKKLIVVILALYFLLFLSLYIIKNKLYITSPFIIVKDIVFKLDNISDNIINIKFDDNLKDSFYNELIVDNNELKELLNLNNTYSFFDLKHALILSRDPLLNKFTIDIGIKENVSIGSPVITKDGVIGIITFVSKTTSEVSPILNNKDSSKIAVTINNQEGIAYYSIDYSSVIVEGITNIKQIKENDEVYTSSLSSLYNPKLFIGKVEKIEKDENGVERIVKIKRDINEYNYVSVIIK